MEKPKQPPKELVHRWMTRSRAEHKPVPTMEEIRQQLGWKLIRKPK